ncbi:hypothetical protein Pan97_32010 [Bremerella volcania]|uniref:Type 4 fimbrial biogenesis protein PilX N-terminal domain-containing protein n=1 Tax=Bremerella volcania TaxID=2527984 RepID=A0A518CAA5_9BACT|nr:hypothetical protein [Bremerella volcania]QDU76156.1 hypothetical protein Pan97_32010 [Bremerella volcania]
MPLHQHKPNQPKRSPKRGFALLLVLVVMVLTSLILAGIGNGLTTQFSAYRNTADYDQALYLAGAGAHHAIAMLEEDNAWRGSISNIELPAGSGNRYSVTAADGDPGEIVITATGEAGDVTRRLECVVSTSG